MENQNRYVRTVGLFGAKEATVTAFLRETLSNFPNLTVTPLLNGAELSLQIVARATTQAQANDLIAPLANQLTDRFAECFYGFDMENLQTALVRLLMQKGLTIATAESCTGGLISKKITEVPGSSAVFGCGVCAYANEIKEKLLGVHHETLAQYGAVSSQTAMEMADGVRQASGADFAVSTTGLAGPGGGSDQKPVGLVYIGVSCRQGTVAHRFLLGQEGENEREQIRAAACGHALFLVWKAAQQSANR